MGQFNINITAVGGHGVDRSKKSGETVNFKEGDAEHDGNIYQSPDSIAKDFLDKLIKSGVNVENATITHWPGSASEVTDNLITGERTGNF